MGRPIVRAGDTTPTGGVVVAVRMVTAEGLAVAIATDQVTAHAHGNTPFGPMPIPPGSSTVYCEGKPVVLTGDTAGCGEPILGTPHTVVVE